MIKRKSGILVHPTALYSPYGIGDIGWSAYEFIDHLEEMGQSLWQILPIGPTDAYNSPYSSISTFAGNHMLISLDLLIEDGLLDQNFLNQNYVNNSSLINFKEVHTFKMYILKEVCKYFFEKASSEIYSSFKNFCLDNAYWLDQYSHFIALKKENNQKPWINWSKNKISNKNNIIETKIIQFLFHNQWEKLRSYCKKKNIQIIGDMPLYVAYDSVDVYFNRNLFELDDEGNMVWQSGCPPCEFQKNGQIWGSPIYNWNMHQNTDFKWWNKRFRKLFKMVDIIRLDHFIGFSKYYKIPYKDKNAKNGEWVKAPGEKLFQDLISNINKFNVIAEDLGDISDDVIALREKFNFPGMNVLQFDLSSIPLLTNYKENSIVYTGTHDNDTILGWFKSLPKNSTIKTKLSREMLLNYFNCKEENIHWSFIDYAFASSSNMLIIPIQDILGKDSASRFNQPGTISLQNWSWRMQNKEITKEIKNKLLRLTKKYKRIK